MLEGPNAVKAARQVIGATDPVEADAGSIRGEFGTEVTFNLVHGSDSPESAEREIEIWFPELLILASRSPQRKALLKALGIDFRTVPAEVEETTEGAPQELVLANALAKARAVAARRRQGTLVIAGDTEVVVDGRALGQPGFEGEARWCLETLSGRTHEVLGALALIGPDRVDGELEVRTGVESSRVTFGELAPKLIDCVSRQRRVEGEGRRICGAGAGLRAGRRNRGRRLQCDRSARRAAVAARPRACSRMTSRFSPFWAFKASR